jgi:hypothetical protein
MMRPFVRVGTPTDMDSNDWKESTEPRSLYSAEAYNVAPSWTDASGAVVGESK